jgi:D-serine deaminase-like pyridoxal phosphate-dependent protein
MERWYSVDQATDLSTPALLIYPGRVEENIRRMVKMADGAGMLRPHVKTHKMSEVVKLNMKYGIAKFKCATIAEAEMVAQCGGKDIMLAIQPVGVHISRFFQLQYNFQQSNFSALADTEAIIEQIAGLATQERKVTDIWLDINNGMDRTGIRPGKEALRLYQRISSLPFINPRGLHVYDGHIHERDISDRRKTCEKDFEAVNSFIGDIQTLGLKAPVIVAGGTPTFPLHIGRKNTETSPGTCVLWDSGYAEHFADLDFLPAALVLTRVVSKPNKNLLCLDLGHKALAAEMPHPRVSFLNLPVRRFVNHSEEHLVIETDVANNYHPGDLIYGVPWHICPTVPRYKTAFIIRDGKVTEEWPINARDRMITM